MLIPQTRSKRVNSRRVPAMIREFFLFVSHQQEVRNLTGVRGPEKVCAHCAEERGEHFAMLVASVTFACW